MRGDFKHRTKQSLDLRSLYRVLYIHALQQTKNVISHVQFVSLFPHCVFARGNNFNIAPPPKLRGRTFTDTPCPSVIELPSFCMLHPLSVLFFIDWPGSSRLNQCQSNISPSFDPAKRNSVNTSNLRNYCLYCFSAPLLGRSSRKLPTIRLRLPGPSLLHCARKQSPKNRETLREQKHCRHLENNSDVQVFGAVFS